MSCFVYLNCYGFILNELVCFVAKGLIQVFDKEYPGFEHRFCLRHLYANFKKKFIGGTLFRVLMMVATKAILETYEWLEVIPKTKCCKHAFPFYSKCDILMNNLSDSFNATIFLQRDKPILTMFEWIRNYLMGFILREKTPINVEQPFSNMDQPTINMEQPSINVEPTTQASGLDKYCDRDAETLEAFLSNEEVLDIQPMSIYTSPIKPSASKSVGVKTFFSKKPKTCNNIAFKPPSVVKISA